MAAYSRLQRNRHPFSSPAADKTCSGAVKSVGKPLIDQSNAAVVVFRQLSRATAVCGTQRA